MSKSKDKIRIKKHYSEQLELPEVGLMKLPPKWTVKENSAVGYDFYNENGVLELQHPKDNDSIRSFCWAIYNKIENEN